MRGSDIRGGVRRLARGQAGVRHPTRGQAAGGGSDARRGSGIQRGVKHSASRLLVFPSCALVVKLSRTRGGVRHPDVGSNIPVRGVRRPARGQTPGGGSDIQRGGRHPTWGQAQREPLACFPFVRLCAPLWLNYPAHAAGSDIRRRVRCPARGQTSRRGVRQRYAGVRHSASRLLVFPSCAFVVLYLHSYLWIKFRPRDPYIRLKNVGGRGIKKITAISPELR
jgi:hypothetical protein